MNKGGRVKSSERNIKSFPHSTLLPRAAPTHTHTHRHFHLCAHSITPLLIHPDPAASANHRAAPWPAVALILPTTNDLIPLGGSRPLLVPLLRLPEVTGISSNYRSFFSPYCIQFKLFLAKRVLGVLVLAVCSDKCRFFLSKSLLQDKSVHLSDNFTKF